MLVLALGLIGVLLWGSACSPDPAPVANPMTHAPLPEPDPELGAGVDRQVSYRLVERGGGTEGPCVELVAGGQRAERCDLVLAPGTAIEARRIDAGDSSVVVMVVSDLVARVQLQFASGISTMITDLGSVTHRGARLVHLPYFASDAPGMSLSVVVAVDAEGNELGRAAP